MRQRKGKVRAQEALVALWAEYVRTKDATLRSKLVLAYMPWAKRLARALARKCLKTALLNDRLDAVVLGLLVAVERFNPRLGVTFEKFAVKHVGVAVAGEVHAVSHKIDGREVESVSRDVEGCHVNDQIEALAPTKDRPLFRATERELTEAFAAAPWKLAHRTRLVFYEYCVEQRPLAEVATKYHLTPSVVRRMCRRVCIRLQRQLE